MHGQIFFVFPSACDAACEMLRIYPSPSLIILLSLDNLAATSSVGTWCEQSLVHSKKKVGTKNKKGFLFSECRKVSCSAKGILRNMIILYSFGYTYGWDIQPGR
jgi:hypothetical protein